MIRSTGWTSFRVASGPDQFSLSPNTLGKDSELVEVAIDWAQNPPLIRAAVRVSDPQLPTARQVAAVQAFINGHQPIRYRLVVQRVSVDVIGPETAPNPEDSRPRPPEVGGFAVP